MTAAAQLTSSVGGPTAPTLDKLAESPPTALTAGHATHVRKLAGPEGPYLACSNFGLARSPTVLTAFGVPELKVTA